jgi:hypothetical protein
LSAEATKTFGFNRPHLFVPTLSWQKINFFYHESKWRQKRCFPRTALEPGAIVTADDSALNDELSLPMVMLHCSGDAAPSPCTASVAASTSAGAGGGIAAWGACLDEDEDDDEDAKRILPELNVAESKHGPAEDTFSPQRSLCLSRACLGKLIEFSLNVAPTRRLPHREGSLPAANSQHPLSLSPMMTPAPLRLPAAAAAAAAA